MTTHGPAKGREKAEALIMAGAVFMDGQWEGKTGQSFPPEATIEVRGSRLPCANRDGLKFRKTPKEFPFSFTGKICMDVGVSTGGFTDCTLQSGTLKAYAVDVGHNQLDWKPRSDTHAVCLEKINIYYATWQEVPEEITFSPIDVSLISLGKMLPAVRALLFVEGEVVMLIKPQFEAGGEQIGKHGVIREPKIYAEVVKRMLGYVAASGFVLHGSSFSSTRGSEGSVEYLIWFHTAGESKGVPAVTPEAARAVVHAAHGTPAGRKA